jgi:hypothetical protein
LSLFILNPGKKKKKKRKKKRHTSSLTLCCSLSLFPSKCSNTFPPSKQSQKYHLENPYWQTFDKYVIPLLAKDMDLRRLNELVDEKSEQVRVEQDPKLWEEVKKHQIY